MPRQTSLNCKLVWLGFFAALNFFLLFLSLRFNYQWELVREHIQFRKGFPSQANWMFSPNGRLKCYLFNVTNAEEFLNGTDSRMKVQEVGPITYSIQGFNKIIEQTEDTLTYEKIRHYSSAFEPLESISPDILNKTIILPNFVLLSAAAKLHDWVFPVRHVFNVLTINEKVFLKNTVYYFLWDFKLPALNVLSNYMPNIVSNCGVLYNALLPKEEIYKVKIGKKGGFNNFFRVITVNNRTVFKEHQEKQILLQNTHSNIDCPIEVENAFDNSLYTPFLKPTDEFDIVAYEICRTMRLKFSRAMEYDGYNAYRYTLGEKSEKPTCLQKSMGIPLYKGMFDVSRCLFNDVPAAFSSPHFYGSNYNWSKHYEGFAPNAEEHEAIIIMEPTTGTPLEEKYRFQSNIPMPNMAGYSKDLEKFSNLMVPSFWYEFDMDELPLIVRILMVSNVFVAPILQPTMIVVFLMLGILFSVKMFFLWSGTSFKEMINKFEKCTGKSLETTFENNGNGNTADMEIGLK